MLPCYCKLGGGGYRAFVTYRHVEVLIPATNSFGKTVPEPGRGGGLETALHYDLLSVFVCNAQLAVQSTVCLLYYLTVKWNFD